MQKEDSVNVFSNLVQTEKIENAVLVIETKNSSFTLNANSRNGEFKKINNDDSLYQIGSITKVFTALVTASLILNKTISLNTKIGEIFGKFEINDSFKTISIFQLLTHTSGLPRLPSNFMQYCNSIENPYINYGEVQLIEYLQSQQRILATKKMQYSNLGYGLLGFALEIVTNKSFNELLNKTICVPLKMENTFIYNSKIKLSNIIQGYNENDKPISNWDMNILSPAGGIISTPRDMRYFLKELIKPKPQKGALFSYVLNPLNNEMAYGLIRKNLLPHIIRSEETLWHNGMTGGFASYIEINPHEQKGFILLYNKAINPDIILSNPIFTKIIN